MSHSADLVRCIFAVSTLLCGFDVTPPEMPILACRSIPWRVVAGFSH